MTKPAKKPKQPRNPKPDQMPDRWILSCWMCGFSCESNYPETQCWQCGASANECYAPGPAKPE